MKTGFLNAEQLYYSKMLFDSRISSNNIELRINQIENKPGEEADKLIFLSYWKMFQDIKRKGCTEEEKHKLFKGGKELVKVTEGWLWQFNGDTDALLESSNHIKEALCEALENDYVSRERVVGIAMVCESMFNLSDFIRTEN